MSRRTRIALLVTAVLAVFLSSFLVVQAVGVTLLDDPSSALEGGGIWPAVLGVSLLIADALLPVPSSLVMISLGALYGAFLGAALAFAGRFGMAVVGLWLGRAGAPIVVKLIGPARGIHADQLVERWGAFSIVVSRPVPLLAEAVVLAAGAARLPWRVALPAAFVGSLPEAIAYGAVGAAATSAANGAYVWLAFLLVGTLFRLGELAVRRNGRRAHTTPAVVLED
jgi:uncharacterized membrane protein YdjX (TVP38/TMEM64 family)